MLSTAFGRFVNFFRKKQQYQKQQQQESEQQQRQPKTEMETITTTTSATTSSSNYCKIDEIRNFLLVNFEFLDDFVMNEIDVETVEKWLIRKTQRLRRISDRSLMAVVAEEISEETEAIVSAAKTIACATGYAAAECDDGGGGSGAAGSKSPRKTSLSRWKFCVHADKRKMLQEMTQSLQIKPAKDHVLWELANCISSAINADGFCLYIVDEYTKSLISLRVYDAEQDQRITRQPAGRQFRLRRTTNSSNNGPESVQSANGDGFENDFGMKISLAEHVASTKKALRMKRSKLQEFFDVSQYENLDDMAHVLCQPIVQPDNQLAAVLEMWRKDSNSAFHEEDDEIVCSYLVWGGIALHYAHLFVNLNKQKKLNDFLLVVVKSIFHDMISIDSLVTKIMNFAQKLVDADRASLFLLDAKSRELYATIFDVGNQNGNENMTENNGGDNCEREQSEVPTMTTSTSTDTNNKMFRPENGEIRFPIGTGIAGIVALTGKILNISDAYSDSRFNRTIDQITGYKTETILCMPIYTRNTIIGVVQMINKRFGSFTKEDELAFETFAVYCGLALHHAKLYDKIRRSEQKYKVALDVLTYHNTCTDIEYEQISENPELLSTDVDFGSCNDYDLNPFAIDDTDKVRFALFMFTDLFGLAKFEQSRLIRFVLTVKKNYRRVPYHNWTHGFAVAHCMYTILKRATGYFRPHECLALFIASLCHDLDHRGKNNKFMLDTESPLAAVYSTSTMEHHHFNQTVIILQQEQNNIFNKFTNSEYKQILSLLKHCIIATDLVVFFQNKSRMTDIVSKKKFNWSTREHRQLILAIAMTACDLCASAKPWPIQKDTVQLIFEEFYQQGDEEKRFGLEPIAMMDRTKIDYQPASQVSFLTNICIPCYSLLSDVVPETKPLLDACNLNLNKWREIDKCKNSTHNRDLT